MKTYVHTIYTQMFDVALFVNTKIGNNFNALQWMNRETVVHPHNGILLSNTKAYTTDTCNTLGKSQRQYVSKRSKSEKVICYGIPFV